ncbi:LysM domain-containing protein [Colletotrichum siamense]|uniref:LysM domain-containing protein n=1 Tax=Colletotrichum siamense TaxID=690259 RepID=UPI0018727CE3|nr:LysM domain-containing protein [Colletotrichum siamense]KAF5483035.1 LysM domain-containing protein [Colletotrichum siamense]
MVSDCDKFYLIPQDSGCQAAANKNGITLADFINASYGGLWANTYAGVSIIGYEPTLVQPGNGVATPSPIQSSMVTNHDTFHFVRSDESCRIIADKFGITVANFVAWNSAVGSSCAGLWANTYACITVL